MLNEINQLFKFHLGNQKNLARHDSDRVFKQTINDLEKNSFLNDDFSDLKILDLGCGQRFPFSIQSCLKGADVTSVDMDYVKPGNLFKSSLKIIKNNGLKRSVKTIFRKLILDKKYYNELVGLNQKQLVEESQKIKFMVFDPLSSKYPLKSSAFDLIVSNAVLEHVENIDMFSKEIKRLLKPKGFFYGIIHNYYSISGGHNLEWAYPDTNPSKKIPPWDHLLDNDYPTFVFLNKLKPEEYLKKFKLDFKICNFSGCDITHNTNKPEGLYYYNRLTDNRLKEYSKELLTTRSYKVILQKI